jgi:hypothetical protein
VLSLPGTQIASIPPRLGQVPGTDFQPGTQIASIPPRLGQVPGTGFQPSQQIASISAASWQVPGTEFLPGRRLLASSRVVDRCLACPGQVPGNDLAAVSIRSGRSPKRKWIRRAGCLAY